MGMVDELEKVRPGSRETRLIEQPRAAGGPTKAVAKALEGGNRLNDI